MEWPSPHFSTKWEEYSGIRTQSKKTFSQKGLLEISSAIPCSSQSLLSAQVRQLRPLFRVQSRSEHPQGWSFHHLCELFFQCLTMLMVIFGFFMYSCSLYPNWRKRSFQWSGRQAAFMGRGWLEKLDKWSAEKRLEELLDGNSHLY